MDNKQIIKLHTVAIATGLPKGCRGASASGSITSIHTRIPKGGVRVVLRREPFRGNRQELAQMGSSPPAPLPKESLGRCEDFWILGRDLQKCGLRTATELSGLTAGTGDGR